MRGIKERERLRARAQAKKCVSRDQTHVSYAKRGAGAAAAAAAAALVSVIARGARRRRGGRGGWGEVKNEREVSETGAKAAATSLTLHFAPGSSRAARPPAAA